jgi:hypothetical protein
MNIYTVIEFYKNIHASNFGRAEFDDWGFYYGKIINFYVAIPLLIINLFISRNKSKIYPELYNVINVLLLVDCVFLIIARKLV